MQKTASALMLKRCKVGSFPELQILPLFAELWFFFYFMFGYPLFQPLGLRSRVLSVLIDRLHVCDYLSIVLVVLRGCNSTVSFVHLCSRKDKLCLIFCSRIYPEVIVVPVKLFSLLFSVSFTRYLLSNLCQPACLLYQIPFLRCFDQS